MFRTREKKENLLNRSGIYLITLRGTNRHYVGQARRLWKRMRSHINSANSSGQCSWGKLYNAIRKYGSDAFDYSVLAFCDPGSLDRLETFYITVFNAVEPIGFNLQEFSTTCDHVGYLSDEHRRKISVANTGKKRSPETLQRMRESALKKAPISEETRAKQSASHKGFKQSPEQVEKLRKRMLGTKHTAKTKAIMATKALLRARPVQQFHKITGELIANHPSVCAAVRATGSHINNITAALRGRLKTHNGYIWKYAATGQN